jgi:hypothetical protein
MLHHLLKVYNSSEYIRELLNMPMCDHESCGWLQRHVSTFACNIWGKPWNLVILARTPFEIRSVFDECLNDRVMAVFQVHPLLRNVCPSLAQPAAILVLCCLKPSLLWALATFVSFSVRDVLNPYDLETIFHYNKPIHMCVIHTFTFTHYYFRVSVCIVCTLSGTSLSFGKIFRKTRT